VEVESWGRISSTSVGTPKLGSKVKSLTKLAGDAIQVEPVRLFVVFYGLCNRGEFLVFEERITFSVLLGIRDPIIPRFGIILVFVFVDEDKARPGVDIVLGSLDDVLRR
jgi:hypothetical protein